MQRVLITGAGRGIGLALAEEYAQRGDRVFAAYRTPGRAGALHDLFLRFPTELTGIQLDVAAPDSVEAAVRLVTKQTAALDVLVNNAATSPGDIMAKNADGSHVMDADRALEFFRVNSIAPVQVAQALLPLLLAGTAPRVINISSDSGSLTHRTGRGNFSYSASKAALNMYTRALAWTFQQDGITVVALHPGWVKTDMGGPEAPMPLKDCSTAVVNVIDGLRIDDTGSFLDYTGAHLPW